MRSKTQGQIPKSVVLRQISQQAIMKIYKLVPKHLSVKGKKSASLKELQYKQSISDKIAKEKIKYTMPLTDVQLIMKKFDEVSQEKKFVGETPRDSETIRQKSQSDLDKRIKGLLALPTVKNIKQKVNQEKYRKGMEPQTATLAIFAQSARLSLIRRYDEYIKRAIKPVTKHSRYEIN